jgi:predicted ATPase
LPNFASIELNRWRQFERVDIDLDQQVTILTGANGSGKTTIVNTLSMHFGWSLGLVASPRRRRRLELMWSDVIADKFFDEDEGLPNDVVPVGAITYDNGGVCTLATPRFVSANYQLQFGSIQQVPGLYVPSHRPVAAYNPVTNIPTDPIEVQNSYQQYQQFMLQMLGGQGANRNPGQIQKQSLISLAVFGEGNSSVPGNAEYLQRFNDFQHKLRIMLPRELGFKRLEVRGGDLVLITASGDFSLDAMSGGVNAVFGLAWQISMFQAPTDHFTVIIDEPENHLHPSMQRGLLPALAEAYPSTRFIISTHSPFIVTSFPAAGVYALFHGRGHRVRSERLETADLSGTPNKVLRDVLDVPSTLPLWVEKEVDTLLGQTEHLPPEQKGKAVLDALNRMGISSALSEYKNRPAR